jgi:microsomal dipeptidase-like Zn-dependent dipeptidase
MNVEKISSGHEDLSLPHDMRKMGEYDSDNFPERGKEPMISRLSQFGIDVDSVEERLGKRIDRMSWEEYASLVSETVRLHYDTVVASVYDKFNFSGMPEKQDDQRMREMFDSIKRFEGMGGNLGVNLIKEKSDFRKDSNIVLGLENGAHLIKDLADARNLADRGIKIFGLQYNTDTPLATNRDGLTELGREVVKDLFSKNLIVDLAHSGANTRRDVIETARDRGVGHLVSYTHGCTEEDIEDAWRNKTGERALGKNEFQELIKMGSIIGLGVTKPFFASTRKVAERINEACQIEGGVEKIAVGSDFGGVPPQFLNEIKSVKDFDILAEELSVNFGLSDDHINKILRTNIKDWLKGSLRSSGSE